jgi:hypothetical protein
MPLSLGYVSPATYLGEGHKRVPRWNITKTRTNNFCSR